MSYAAEAPTSTAERLADLAQTGQFNEVGQFVTQELLAGSSSVEPWLLSVILESANRLASDLQLIERSRAETDERMRRLEEGRGQLLVLIDQLIHEAEDTPHQRTDTAGDAGELSEAATKGSAEQCRLTVFSFGSLIVYVDAEKVTGWNGNSSQLVLSVLLAQPRRRARKEMLMETLWVDAEPSTSRRRLHQTVYTLRKAFAHVRPDIEFILFERDHYLVNPKLIVEDDVGTFEALVASCRSGALSHPDRLRSLAGSLLDLYRADYLEDTPYEEWVVRQRERLRLAFVSTAEELAESLAGAGYIDDAAVLMQRVLEFDPANEAAHRHMMRAHHLAGRQHFVTAQFDACTIAVRAEFGVDPSAATKAVFAELMSARR